jgi:peptidoglycan/LPS O-acetylase OafA/YrhL
MTAMTMRAATVYRRGDRLSAPLRHVAIVMGSVAATLVVASSIHLFGHVKGRSDMFDSTDAGIAEAVIACVLAAGSVAMVRSPRRARAIGGAALGFATLGFLVGLSITARSGHLPDIAYHLLVLPVLVGCLIVLARSRHDSV